MADDLRMRLTGLSVLEKNLEALDRRAARRVGLAGLRGSARVVKRAAKRAAPKRRTDLDRIFTLGRRSSRTRAPGFLKRTTIYRTVRGELAILVGPRRAAFYGKFFEPGGGGRHMPKTAWFSRSFRNVARAAFEAAAPAAWKQLTKEVDRA